MPRVRGEAIRAEYTRRGYKLADVAQATRINRGTLTNALSKARHSLDESKIARLADFLGWDPKALVDDGTEPAATSSAAAGTSAEAPDSGPPASTEAKDLRRGTAA